MRIHELSEDVISKIAAGEVVEAPYSVVRELVENAVDAGAGRIIVRIYSGGKEKIVVSDDGVGIQKEDLSLAVKRYTTSKLSVIDDLNTSNMLGFRGEALASISAVSHFELCSFHEEGAYKIVVDFGQVRGIKPCSLDRGTVVIVENLFANFPARLKFLRSAQSEGKRVASVVESYILGFPSISFEFWSDDRRVYSSNRDSELYDTWVSVFGKDVAEKLNLVVSEEEGRRVMGIISSPYLERKRPYISFMVNGHPVRSNLLRRALVDAYAGYLPPGWSFVSFIRIDIPPSELDFNVHPAKWEVKFRDDSSIYKFVYNVVRSSLGRIVLPRGVESKNKVVEDESVVLEYDKKYGGKLPIKELEVKESTSLFGVGGRDFKVLGQLWDTYILVEKGDYFYIVDQHVASEKIIYEELISTLEGGDVDKQKLLFPKVIDCGLDYNYVDILRKCGFEIDEFGEGKFIVRAVPSIIQAYRDVPVDVLIREAVMQSDGGTSSPLHSLISSIACRSAVKAGERLSLHEQEVLLTRLFDLDNFLFCPHGRPIIIEFGRGRIEEMFKRR